MYQIEGANGKIRNTTLRDARKHDLVPSVTTILNVAAKPGLENWKLQQVLLAALTLPKRDQESESEYIDRIITDSKEQGRAAAALHALRVPAAGQRDQLAHGRASAVAAGCIEGRSCGRRGERIGRGHQCLPTGHRRDGAAWA